MNYEEYIKYLKPMAEKISSFSIEKYLEKPSQFTSEDQFLIVARHWNSETPIVPKFKDENGDYLYQITRYGLGGGYLIISNGVGIAIDPGYNFLQILYTIYGITINDIHMVFITHDHPDHFADLINIITLKRKSVNKFLELYLSKEVMKIFKPFCSSETFRSFTLFPNQKFELDIGKGSIIVNTLRALHNERMFPYLDSPFSLGFMFQIKSEKKSDKYYNIAITGDTRFPSEYKRYKGRFKEFNKDDIDEFIKQYYKIEIDILCMHIGSLEKDFGKIENEKEFEKVRYSGYHLGFNGCKDLLNIIKKRKEKKLIAVLTEFGVELKGYRKNLARLLESQNSDKQIIIPADLEFTIDFSEPGNEKFLCSKCRQLLNENQDNSKLSSFPFHNISEIIYFEDLQTEMIKYQGNEMSCGLFIHNN